MTYFFGNKRVFGVEIEPYPIGLRAEIKIWINNFAIGNPRDDDFIEIFNSYLKKMCEFDFLNSKISEMSNPAILEMIKSENNESEYLSSTVIFLGESFDGYIIRRFFVNDTRIKIVTVSAGEVNKENFLLTIDVEQDDIQKIANDIDWLIDILKLTREYR